MSSIFMSRPYLNTSNLEQSLFQMKCFDVQVFDLWFRTYLNLVTVQLGPGYCGSLLWKFVEFTNLWEITTSGVQCGIVDRSVQVWYTVQIIKISWSVEAWLNNCLKKITSEKFIQSLLLLSCFHPICVKWMNVKKYFLTPTSCGLRLRCWNLEPLQW